MSWLGKVIGGVIGFAAGGPVGAAIGVGVGHGVDWLAGGRKKGEQYLDAGDPRGTDRSGLEVAARFGDDGVGRLCTFQVRSPIPDNSQCVVQLLDAQGALVAGQAPFVTAQGDFFVAAPIFDGHCRVYIPLGAIDYSRAGSFVLGFTAMQAPLGSVNFSVLGTAEFDIELPDPRPWSKVEWLEPLIGLCMAVVHADERVLTAEVRLVKTYFSEVFELASHELGDSKRAMKRGPPERLDETVAAVATRLPGLGVDEVLAVLTDVALCDGELHPSEIEVIHRVANAMGLGAQWERIAGELGLDGRASQTPGARGGPSTDEALATLGLDPGASRGEVQAAYRKLASDYHPDRVSHLSQEFRDMAHDKMAHINAAYQALRNSR